MFYKIASLFILFRTIAQKCFQRTVFSYLFEKQWKLLPPNPETLCIEKKFLREGIFVAKECTQIMEEKHSNVFGKMKEKKGLKGIGTMTVKNIACVLTNTEKKKGWNVVGTKMDKRILCVLGKMEDEMGWKEYGTLEEQNLLSGKTELTYKISN